MNPSTPKTELPPSTQLRKAAFGGTQRKVRAAIRKKISATAALILVLCLTDAASAGTLFVELNGIKMGFDEQTGGLVHLSQPGVGAILETAPESAGLVDVAYPIDEFLPMRLATRFSKARIVQDKDEVRILWDQLGPSRTQLPLPKGHVSAEVKLRAAPNGKSVIMTCRIENHSEAPVPQIIFPDLWGLRPVGGAEKTKLHLLGKTVAPFTGPVVDSLRTRFYAMEGGAWNSYALPKFDRERDGLRMVELAGPDGGITVFAAPGAQWANRVFTHRTEVHPNLLRLLWEHQDPIKPGENWESGEYWLTPYSGTKVNGFPQVRRVTMNGLEIGVDEETGNLVHLSHAATGVLLQALDKANGLIALTLDTAVRERDDLWTRHGKAQVVEAGGELRISWEGLRVADDSQRKNFQTTKVGASVTIRPAADGKSVIMSCRIDNRSDKPVKLVKFPDLHQLQPLSDPEHTILRLPKSRENFVFRERTGWQYYKRHGYPGQCALRWLDYGTYGGGLSMFQRSWATPGNEKGIHVLTHRDPAEPLRVRLACLQDPDIQPGASWDSGEFWLTPHRGGWAKGIEPFREYVREAAPKRVVNLPDHVKNGLGCRTIWMIEATETDPKKAAFTFADLPAVARDAKAHGLDELVLWTWCNYFELPIRANEKLGTREELLRGIRAARELGVNVSLFISVMLVKPSQGEEYGVRPDTRFSDWTCHTELIPIFRPYYTASFKSSFNALPTLGAENRVWGDNQTWLADVEKDLRDWIDLGATSFCWDLWGPPPALVEMMSRVRVAARQNDPNCTFSGECTGPDDLAGLERDCAILDYTWNWNDQPVADPVISVLRSPRLNVNVEASPLVAKKAFCSGHYLNVFPRKPDRYNGSALISEKPELSKAVKECAALRRQFLPYFVEGTLIGDSVLLKPTRAYVRAHVLGDKMLVFVLNERDEPQKVRLQSELDLWLPKSASYEIKAYDSTGKPLATTTGEANWSTTTRSLASGELAVFEIQAGKSAGSN